MRLDINQLIDEVDDERIYQHVLKLEGIRHFAIDPEFLEESANYIIAELLSSGAEVIEHKMEFDGVPHVFRNIEGCVGEKGKPELLVLGGYALGFYGVPRCGEFVIFDIAGNGV